MIKKSEKLTVLLELTRKCNLTCDHCYNSSSPTSEISLNISDINQVIMDLKNIESANGIERIILTGGEFILMPEAPQIFNLFKENFKIPIRIETNGFLFKKNPELLKVFDADEFYISIDKLHGSVNNDGSSSILDVFLKESNNNKKYIVRFTLNRGEEDIRDLFLAKYSKIDNLFLESKYVSPSGRAKDKIKLFNGYKYDDNPSLFNCLAKTNILFNTDKKWYACYTACKISYVSNLGDPEIGKKMFEKRNSDIMKKLQITGPKFLAKEDELNDFDDKTFYYRCEPCLFLQKNIKKSIILIDLPAVDTTQDVYIKGFIFPTFTEKYLKPMLELADIEVKYYNLNKENINAVINGLRSTDDPIYIHLTPNKYYSYSIFKKSLNGHTFLLGGPLPKFASEIFEDEFIINDELEEEGILRFLSIDKRELWSSNELKPLQIDTYYSNKSVQEDFSNIIIFGRGCSYNCKFCIHSCFHKNIKMRSIESIQAELNLYNNKNISVYIADPTVGNLKIYSEILVLLSKYKNIKFSMNLRADQVNSELVILLKNINLDKLYIGVESTSESELIKYKKGESINQIDKGLSILLANGFNYHLSFIISNDTTLENIIKMDEKYHAKSYSFHFYIPYPGTYGYNPNDKWYTKRNWPITIFKNQQNYDELKDEISNYFGYPKNDYHTITPHDHTETFEIINMKLNELEKSVYEKH